jgi:hypothetical protein
MPDFSHMACDILGRVSHSLPLSIFTLQPFLIDLAQGGSHVHDLYVQPHGCTESAFQNCVVDRPKKTSAWTERRAREALKVLPNADLSKSTTAADTQGIPSLPLGSHTTIMGLHLEDGFMKAQAASFVKAEALWTLGRQQEARRAWQECADAKNQSMALTALCAWRWVRNAASENQEKNTAVTALIKIAEEPSVQSPELLWLAAFTRYYAGEYESAKRLALESVELGCFTGKCVPQGRVHSEEARHEWPLDVLYYSLSKLGSTASAEKAKAQRDIAKADRLSRAALAAV